MLYDVPQIRLNIQPFQGVMNLSRDSPEVFLLFHEVNLMSLVGYGEGGRHAGYASTDHQRPFVDGQIEFLQGLQMAGPRHRHPDDVLCLFRGLFLFFLVDPGVMLPDIRHVVVILVDARLPEGVPEERLKGPGAAGGDNHPIEPFFPCHSR